MRCDVEHGPDSFFLGALGVGGACSKNGAGDGTALASMTAMTIVSNVLRVLSDFGDAAGWLIAAVVLFVYGRRLLAENEKAHGALDTKIDTVAENDKENRLRITALDTKIDTVAQTLNTKIDTVAQTLGAKIDTVAGDIGAIARDVSFLAGRQAERDRAAGRQE